ncbi:MAG TPA: hypothetical protein VEA36_02590 [Candidatus Paceibacterota bacterium]|nr:hypothetical protein [Candidatus Paceibacterota bacterium]
MFLFVDSQGGVDFSRHEYVDHWEDKMYAVNRQIRSHWSKRQHQPTVVVLLVDARHRVLIVKDGTWHLPEYPLTEGEDFLARAYRGMQEQAGLAPYALYPLHPVLLPELPVITRAGNEPDEQGYRGRAYCAVALQLDEIPDAFALRGDHGNGPPLEGRWLSPDRAAAQLIPCAGDTIERFTQVDRPALRALADLILAHRLQRPPESRSFTST